ncbi:MAG TPA: tyrosine-type recombinase/integrase [Desulfobacteraceae bacterium]|nr:tyrosine-type recombinase/integrase [Desulfobacteraceae bacterium]HPQ28626.1 tyrosine-type recombinase/integrase [Desulfobacteraceae bacterium]
MRITKKIIDSQVLPEKGQILLWDSEIRGFGIRLTPSGVSYIVQGRVNGISRRITLGKHGILTVDDARKKARAQIFKMNEGIDPVTEKIKNQTYSLTLKELTDEYLLSRGNRLKDSYRKDIVKHLNKAFLAWSDRPVVEITRDMVQARFMELSKKSHSQTNQAFRILRAILNYAREAHRPGNKPLIPENPVQILSGAKLWHKVRPRNNKIPLDKVGISWNFLRRIRADEFQNTIIHTSSDIISFLLLTGCRWGEAASLKWVDINFDESSWHVKDPKNRMPITRPLSDSCKDILTKRFKEKTSEYVFPGRSGGHIHDARGLFKKLSDEIKTPISAHDLRRTFMAISGELEIEFVITKLLMGHSFQDVTIKHYKETGDLTYLRPYLNKIANWINTQAKIAASKKVVPFPSKRARSES